jgi:hypothetical protein
LENGDFARFTVLGRHHRITAAFDGRKWLDFLHVRLDLTLEIRLVTLANLYCLPRMRLVPTPANLRKYRLLAKSSATHS